MSNQMGPDEPKLSVPLTEEDLSGNSGTVAPEAGAEGTIKEEVSEQPMSLEQLEILINEFLINPKFLRNDYLIENVIKLKGRLSDKNNKFIFKELMPQRESSKLLFEFLRDAKEAAKAKAEATATATAETVAGAEPTEEITIPDITSLVKIRNEILFKTDLAIKDYLQPFNSKPSAPIGILSNENLSKPILPLLSQLRLPAEIDTVKKLQEWVATEEGKEWFKRLASYDPDSRTYKDKKRAGILLRLLALDPSIDDPKIK